MLLFWQSWGAFLVSLSIHLLYLHPRALFPVGLPVRNMWAPLFTSSPSSFLRNWVRQGCLVRMQAGRGEQLSLAADSSATGACGVAFKYQPHTQTTLWQYERFPWWQNAGHDLCKCNQSTGIGMWDRFNFFSGGSSVVQAIQRVLHWQTTCYLCQDSSA